MDFWAGAEFRRVGNSLLLGRPRGKAWLWRWDSVCGHDSWCGAEKAFRRLKRLPCTVMSGFASDSANRNEHEMIWSLSVIVVSRCLKGWGFCRIGCPGRLESVRHPRG